MKIRVLYAVFSVGRVDIEVTNHAPAHKLVHQKPQCELDVFSMENSFCKAMSKLYASWAFGYGSVFSTAFQSV